MVAALVLALAEQVQTANPRQQSSVVADYNLQAPISDLIEAEQAQVLGVLPCLEHANRALNELPDSIHTFFGKLVESNEVKAYLMIHDSEGMTWFNQERMELLIAEVEVLLDVLKPEWQIGSLRTALTLSGFQLDKFLSGLA